MKEYKTKSEAIENNLDFGKWDTELVNVDGNKVILCGTNMPYDSVICDCAIELMNSMPALVEFTSYEDLCEVMEDAVCKYLNLEHEIELVDVYESY